MVRSGFIMTALLLALFAAPVALAAPVAQEAREPLPLLWWLMPLGAVIALVFAYVFYRSVMSREEGTESMIEPLEREISDHLPSAHPPAESAHSFIRQSR